MRLYSQGQGVYEDRRQVASLLGLPLEKVRVIQVANGGGFGGKEDITVQGHAALFALLLQQAGAGAPEPARVDPHASQAPSLGHGIRPGLRPRTAG